MIMKKEHKLILGIAVVLAVAAALSVVAINLTDYSEGDEVVAEDLIGHWYATSVETYDADGNYVYDTYQTDKNLGRYDIDVYTVDDDVLAGRLDKSPMTGAYGIMGELSILGTVVGQDVEFQGRLVDKDTMTLISVRTTNGYSSAYIYMFTKDSTRPIESLPDNPDLKGTWNTVSEVCTDSGEYIEAGLQSSIVLKITEQNGHLAKGKIEYGSHTYDVRLVIMPSVVGGCKGYSITDEGIISSVLVSDKWLSILSIGATEDGVRGTKCVFALDEKEPYSKYVSGLKGTVWKTSAGVQMMGDGTILDRVRITTVEFTDEVDGVLIGKWTHGIYSSTIIFSVQQVEDTIKLHVIWAEPSGTFVKLGYLTDGQMSLYGPHIANGVKSTNYIFLEEVKDVINAKITGHWYASNLMVVDKDSMSIKNLTVTNSNTMSTYDLDIYSDTNGTAYMRYGEEMLIGAYVDGLLSVDGSSDPLRKNYYCGWMESDTSLKMIMISTWKDSNDDITHESDIMLVTYSRTRGDIIIPVPSIDIKGTWITANPAGMSESKKVVDLEGEMLTVNELNNGVFIGTMERTYGDRIVEVAVYGIITPMVWGTVQGRMIDELGYLWNVQYSDGQLWMNTLGMSLIDEMSGEMNVIDRKYLREGDNRPEIYIGNMVSEWKGSVGYTIDCNGVSTEFVPQNMTFVAEEQWRNCFTGYITDANGNIWHMIAYNINNVGQPMYRIMISGDSLDSPGYGIYWTYNENTYLLINYTVEEVWYTSLITLTDATS